MQRELAPVILFTYNRPDHTEKVLNALAVNYLASETNLYIFCDGPKNVKAVEKNQLTRRIIKDEVEKGRFKSVKIRISENNKGLARSIISGVTEIISEYGKCIVLEDDHITSRYFLTYMNDALDYFFKDERIWSISGFTYALNSLKQYPHDIYLSYRANSHGWATWQNRWNTVDWTVSDFKQLSRSPIRIWKFNRGGNDLFRMLRHQVRGERDSWAIRFCYSQSKQNKLAVYPRVSLVKNIGFDGSGTHCQAMDGELNSDFQAEIDCIKIEDVRLNKDIVRDFKRMYSVKFLEAMDWGVKKIKVLFRGN